jgi:hypothetical protein
VDGDEGGAVFVIDAWSVESDDQVKGLIEVEQVGGRAEFDILAPFLQANDGGDAGVAGVGVAGEIPEIARGPSEKGVHDGAGEGFGGGMGVLGLGAQAVGEGVSDEEGGQNEASGFEHGENLSMEGGKAGRGKGSGLMRGPNEMTVEGSPFF